MHDASSEQTSRTSAAAPVDSASLASLLRPALAEALARALGREVSEIAFFRTEWQRGGAATGRVRLRAGGGPADECIVKLPVHDAELRWYRRLGRGNDPTHADPVRGDHSRETDARDVPSRDVPSRDIASHDTASREAHAPVVARLYASGEELGGFDLAWIAVERIPHGPPLRAITAEDLTALVDAGARFALAASRFAIDREVQCEPWREHVARALDTARARQLDHHQVWLGLLKQVTRDLDALASLWQSHETDGWIHGDLHPGNGLRHAPHVGSPVTLIDLANVRPGHWLEDAVYLERLLWTRPALLASARPVRRMADARRALGLGLGPDWDRLARVRRVLLAATAPAFLRSEGSPAFLAACIGQLEENLRQLGALRAPTKALESL